MATIWSVGTTFKVKSNDTIETWTVDTVSDVEHGVISAQSPFGKFLLATVPGQKSKFHQPDGEEVEYEVISVSSPDHPEELVMRLTELVARIFKRGDISQNDEEWLEERGHFELLARYHEHKFAKTRRATHAVKASKYWRKAGNPELALRVTEGIEERDPKVMSMIETTRGGAFRDLANLPQAEKCARNAIKLDPTSHYPYNLLGAILYEGGKPEEASRCFEKAEELGSLPHEQEREIINALRRAGKEERQRVRDYLRLTNPQQYQKFTAHLEE